MIHVVLYQPEIPQNTGNIMRTCVATGAFLHLIRPLGFEIDDAHLRRSGVNYIDQLQYKVYDSFDEFQQENRGDYYYFTRYGHKPHTSFDYSDSSRDIYLIFGKESTGIPKEILQKNLEHCMRIPMTVNVRALNLSNCVAICVYEVLRQQNYSTLLFEEPHKGKDYLEREE